MSYDTLVTAEAVQAHLFDHDWCIVDCRHDLIDLEAGWKAYQAGHVPGAVFAHIDEDLSGAKTGTNGRHPLPERESLAGIFREWGIGNDTQIVAYDAHGGQYAARLWWLARWLGHRKAAVLDGGWQAWLARTNWSSVEPPERPRGDFQAKPPLVATADAAAVVHIVGERDRPLLDARNGERYRGEQEPIDPVAGHIPGARNRFWQANLAAAPTGAFKPADHLRAEYEPLLGGIAPARLVHYCGSGISAAHNVLAMEVAGLTDSALYVGSWSEWVADPQRPVATGDED